MCHPVCIRDGSTEQKLSGTLEKLTLVILKTDFVAFFSPLSPHPLVQNRLLGNLQFFSETLSVAQVREGGMCRHLRMQARGQYRESFSLTLDLYFLRPSLFSHWTWNAPIRLACLVSKLQGFLTSTSQSQAYKGLLLCPVLKFQTQVLTLALQHFILRFEAPAHPSPVPNVRRTLAPQTS